MHAFQTHQVTLQHESTAFHLNATVSLVEALFAMRTLLVQESAARLHLLLLQHTAASLPAHSSQPA